MSGSRVGEERPSQVSDEVWLWCRSDEHVCADNPQIGKWMLFVNKDVQDSNGLTELDRFWSLTKQVVMNGDLHGAKCSTSFNTGEKPQNAVIICYTCDFEDKVQVKKAADAIRRVISYPKDIYYKTDDATYSGVYRRFGDKNVSTYKHTRANELFERNQNGKGWKLVNV